MSARMTLAALLWASIATAAPPAPPAGPELLSAPDEDCFAPQISATRGAIFYEAFGPDGRLLRQVPLKKKGTLPAPSGEMAQGDPFWVGAKKTGVASLGADGLWSIRVADKPITAASSASDLHGSASPNGQWLVFVSGRSGQGDLYRVPEGKPGQAPERISSGPFAELSPVWSPDSSQVAAVRLTASGRELVLFSGFGAGQTAKETVLVNDRVGVLNATFRPDGQAIAFVARSWSTETAVYTVPVTGGPATSLLKAVRAETPVWLPGKDGRWLLLTVRQDDRLVALDPFGGLAVVATGAFGHGELAAAQVGGDRLLIFTALGLQNEATPRSYGRAGVYRMTLPAEIQ